MAQFRIDSIASLTRQMAFAPRAKRLGQLCAAEDLLLRMDPEKAYPEGFVVHALTGFRPKTADTEDAELLAGAALQHDLGLLLEQVSDEMDLPALDAGEPILAISDVCDRFGVTSKTIQRWRRRGLPARRYLFDDGKKRVGFRLSCVERFVARQEGAARRPAGVEPLTEPQQAWIERCAGRLAAAGQCRQEIIRRVARRVGRSSLAVLHTLELHDRLHPEYSILPAAGEPLSGQELGHVATGLNRGDGLGRIARELGRPRITIYRAILERRAEIIAGAAVRYHDDPLYHHDDPAQAEHDIDLLVRAAAEALSSDAGRADEQDRVPRNLPAYLADLYRTPLLTQTMERALFLKLNFHKYRFAELRTQLDPHLCGHRDLERLEHHLAVAQETKNRIVTANLRLVVSVARKHLRGDLDLMELVSDGNIVLMRAVDGFDVNRGFRFSTYATLALMKGFARSVPQMQSATREAAGDLIDTAPGRDEGMRRLHDADEVQALLGRLDPEERDIVAAHFGIYDRSSNGEAVTLEDLGRSLGMTKHRVRQIEQAAFEKLRQFADFVECVS